MFTPFEFDITGRLEAENLLAVVIEPVPQEQTQVGYTSRVRTHKSTLRWKSGWMAPGLTATTLSASSQVSPAQLQGPNRGLSQPPAGIGPCLGSGEEVALQGGIRDR